MGEVVVAVVGEAELEDLAADVLREGPGGGVEVAGIGGGVGQGGVERVLVGEAGDGVLVVVDAHEDAVVGVGGAGAREEAERREVAGLAPASSSSHGGGGGGGWVRVLGIWRAVWWTVDDRERGGGGAREFCWVYKTSGHIGESGLSRLIWTARIAESPMVMTRNFV